MIDLIEIQQAIEELEEKKMNLSVIEKLACLYIVQDHNSNGDVRMLSDANVESQSTPSTEFGQELVKHSIGEVLPILEEHFDCIKLFYPKEYDKVLMKIKSV